jgi:hypothetical protein
MAQIPRVNRNADKLLTSVEDVFERLGNSPDAADVAAVEIRGQTELSVVGKADRLFLRFEAKHGSDWAEGYVLGASR